MNHFLRNFIKEYGYRFIPHYYSADLVIEMIDNKVANFLADEMMTVAIEEQCDEAMESILEIFGPIDEANDAFYSASIYRPEFLEKMVNAGWRPNITVSKRLEGVSKPAMNELTIALNNWCIM